MWEKSTIVAIGIYGGKKDGEAISTSSEWWFSAHQLKNRDCMFLTVQRFGTVSRDLNMGGGGVAVQRWHRACTPNRGSWLGTHHDHPSCVGEMIPDLSGNDKGRSSVLDCLHEPFYNPYMHTFKFPPRHLVKMEYVAHPKEESDWRRPSSKFIYLFI